MKRKFKIFINVSLICCRKGHYFRVLKNGLSVNIDVFSSTEIIVRLSG